MTGANGDGRSRWRRWAIRICAGLLLLVLVVGAVAGLWLGGQLRGSLAQLDGEVSLPGLHAPVVVERDALGVPAIRGQSRDDVARATGFVHAQERFFQMDLLRRQAAGELAELFGSAALALDRSMRIHRFRAVARAALDNQSVETLARLIAYAEGVNAGLAALDAPPPEYLATRTRPAPWQPEDSLLVVLAMYDELQGDDGRRESSLGLMHELLPAPLVSFLTPAGTEWDAPLFGAPIEQPPVPGPEVVDLRSAPATASLSPALREAVYEGAAGSNNWAVAAEHTTGGALLANDMHLGLGLPNIWFRAALVWTDADGIERRAVGVTLPGSPLVIAGSNGRVAWGFTNSYGDWSDLVVVEVDPDDPSRYRAPDGWRAFQRHEEILRTRDGAAERFEVVATIWGPLVDRDPLDRPRALRWVAHDLAGFAIDLDGLERAGDLDSAVEIATRSFIPTQNVALADAAGRVGWTLMGPIPKRVGCDGSVPRSWADGTCRWEGRLDPAAYPRLLDPPDGRIWTANNRVLDGEALETVGNGGYSTGARARQIRDDLFALERATAADLLDVQLDDRAVFLERWRTLLLDVLDHAAVAGDPLRDALRHHVDAGWTGRAGIDSVGYRVVRGFRVFLAQQVFEALTTPCEAADERFDFFRAGQWEGPLWRLIEERPPHLLAPRFATWDEQLLAGVDATLDYFLGEDGTAADLATKTWGQRNTVRIRHPISQAVPALGRFLDIPPEPLPGDAGMPRVQSPGFGASQRMIVSPGREEEGLYHMPGGQSGHPFSPFYRAGHRAWAEGHPTPLLPGPPTHTLTLR